MTIFVQNLGQKWQFFCKILDQAKVFGKNEIFSLDMSALNQNNNFKQNLWSSEKYLGKVSAMYQNDKFN